MSDVCGDYGFQPGTFRKAPTSQAPLIVRARVRMGSSGEVREGYRISRAVKRLPGTIAVEAIGISAPLES